MEALYQNLLTIQWNQVIMWVIGGLLIYLAIAKDMEPTLLLPMSGLLEKIAYIIVPESKETEKRVELDERLLATPTIALRQCHELAGKMARETVEGFRLSLKMLEKYDPEEAKKIRQIEDDTDHYEDVLGTYLTKIARMQISDEDGGAVLKLLKVIGDLERISDHSVNVLESVEELQEKKIRFSDGARHELGILCQALEEILNTTYGAFMQDDLQAARLVEPLEQVIDGLKSTLRDRHILRLTDGECTVEAGFIWSDLLTNLERASDHCSNIALGIIDERAHNMNAHQAVKALRRDDPDYRKNFEIFAQKYAIHSGE